MLAELSLSAGFGAGIEAKKLSLVQVEKQVRAARIGALSKHYRLGVGGLGISKFYYRYAAAAAQLCHGISAMRQPTRIA